MLRTRLWMGSLLIALAVLILVEGRWFAPWYPCLFVAAFLTMIFGSRELLLLMPAECRPDKRVTLAGISLLLLANWWLPIRGIGTGSHLDSWQLIGWVFLSLFMIAFLYEMAIFTGPNRITERIALTLFAFAYLGLLPSFLLQMRWLSGSSEEAVDRSVMAFALTIFVPKCSDIGAYFTGKFLTGRLLGRHPMTPLLSPKKTWQGLTGGLLAAIGTAIGLNQLSPIIPGGTLGAAGFGLTVGLAGVFGDLAESLIKRDSGSKDASKTLPGFGGILDVSDSILFAAPVAYLWLK